MKEEAAFKGAGKAGISWERPSGEKKAPDPLAAARKSEKGGGKGSGKGLPFHKAL